MRAKLSSRHWLQTGRGFEREQAVQQHTAGAIDGHIQAVAVATALATVARLTREDVELRLSGWCMIGPKGEFDCSRTVPEPENLVKPLFDVPVDKGYLAC